jgi:hypothetical protein
MSWSKISVWVKGTRAEVEAEAERRGLIFEFTREVAHAPNAEAPPEGGVWTIGFVQPQQRDLVEAWFRESDKAPCKSGDLLLHT